MKRDAHAGESSRRPPLGKWPATLAALLLGMSASSAFAEPTFSPSAPDVERAPGGTLTIGIATSPQGDGLERLVSADWTEGGGAARRSAELSPQSDSVTIGVPSSATHCEVLDDSLTVTWDGNCFEDTGVGELFCQSPGNTTRTPIRITVKDELTLSPASSTITGGPGSTQTLTLSVSGGIAPYTAESANGAAVTFSGRTLSYTIPADAAGSFTDTISIMGASEGDACGGNAADLSLSVSLDADMLILSPSSQDLGAFQPGDSVQARLSISGGIPGYSAEIVSGPAGAQLSGPSTDGTLTFSYAVPADAQSGDTSVTIEVTDSGEGTTQQSTTASLSFRVDAPSGPALSASPSDISLNATSLVGASNRVTERFSVNGGVAPYTLSVVGVSGGVVGQVEPSQLTSPGTAQYAADIPASAQSDLAFVNRIEVTDAAGNVAVVTVEANVSASDTLSTLPGLTPNQRSVARAVETVCPQLGAISQRTADQEDLFTQCSDMLANPRASGIPETLEQITNEKANAAKTAGIETGTQQLANIGSRLAALRSGAKGLDFGAFSLNVDGESLSGRQLAALAADASGGGASADASFGKWGFFLNGTVNFGDKDKTNNETGFDYSTTGLTAGADYRFSENFIAGGAFGYATNDVDFDSNDGGLETETWHIAAYATSYLTERTYIDAIVEYGWNDYDSKRNIDYQITSSLDAVRRQARASFSGTQFGASLGAGYDINEGPVAFGVYGKAAYLKVDVDNYRENNAGGLNLEMDGFDATSVTTTLGARVSRVFNTDTAVLVPQARVEWEHEYDNDASTLSARFAADPSGTTFLIDTDEPDRDYFRIGLGLSALFPQGVTTYLNYSTLLDKRDWTDHLIDAGVRWEFY